MDDAAFLAAAPDDASCEEEYSAVSLKLVGKHTPLVRSKRFASCWTEPLVSSSDSSGTELHSDAQHDGVMRRFDCGDEENLRGLFDAATASAESDLGEALSGCEAWRRVVGLLPLVAQVQSLLLNDERSRCRQHEERRGRTTNVRFVCYDLSAIDLRPSADGSTAADGTPSATSARSSEHELLHVLAELVSKQRALVDECSVRILLRGLACAARLPSILSALLTASRASLWPSLARRMGIIEAPSRCLPMPPDASRSSASLFSAQESSRRAALEALVSALHAASDAAVAARPRRAAAWHADAFAALSRTCRPLLASRLSELLGSLLRFHLHAVFDRPSRAQVRRRAPDGLPMPSDAFRCLPMPSDAFRCLPMPSDAFRCLPMPSGSSRGASPARC